MKTHDFTKNEANIKILDEDQELYIDITGTFPGVEEGDSVILSRESGKIVYSVNYILYEDGTDNFTAGLLYLKKN